MDLIGGVDWRRALIRMITGIGIDAGFTALMSVLVLPHHLLVVHLVFLQQRSTLHIWVQICLPVVLVEYLVTRSPMPLVFQ